MFVQVIEGKVADAEGIRRLADRWRVELQPGAAGYLGTTGGVSPDGRFILAVRFETADAARANSERPEQGAFWAEMEKHFDGPVTFSESTDIDTFRAGGSDAAGFVQVMKDSGVDRATMSAFDQKFEQLAAGFRPDLIGGVRVWTSPDSYIEFAYFTSEAEARAGEKTAPPPEIADLFGEFEAAVANVEYVDLPDPILNSK